MGHIWHKNGCMYLKCAILQVWHVNSYPVKPLPPSGECTYPSPKSFIIIPPSRLSTPQPQSHAGLLSITRDEFAFYRNLYNMNHTVFIFSLAFFSLGIIILITSQAVACISSSLCFVAGERSLCRYAIVYPFTSWWTFESLTNTRKADRIVWVCVFLQGTCFHFCKEGA